VEGLGGAQRILDINYYRHRSASLCLVLPPVGGARSAILLLESIECFIGSRLFSNPEIQIQVCSPGRLDARRSALLAIGFYLGSDTLRRYVLKDLATYFAKNRHYPRGRRLVLYDAEGDFDRRFDWWAGSGEHRLVRTNDPKSDDDDRFFAALQELVAYAFEEAVRIKKGGFFRGWRELPARSSRGILQEVQSLLQKYRSELVRQSRLFDQGGRA
jgi:hypothetical protein